jgi:hypothetical protein
MMASLEMLSYRDKLIREADERAREMVRKANL